MPVRTQQASRDQPVTFTADSVEYDRENSLVIADGHVEAWQDDHVLRADRVTFDRNTGVAAAKRQCRAARAGRAGAVRRLRRTDPGHEQWRAARHARDSCRERQTGSKRCAAHRGQDQRAVAGRLFHLQPLREGPDQAAALADPCALGGAGSRAQEDRVPRMPCWRCTAFPLATCRISGTPILR